VNAPDTISEVTSAAPSPPLLKVTDLRVGLKRGDRILNAVDGVSFHIDAGETLGIVGESGSGKSTTGLAIMRLTPKSSNRHLQGQVMFDGRDLLQMTDGEIRRLRGREISMVLQDPMASLNPVFKIGEQVAEGIATHQSITRRDLRSRVIDALRHVRIPDPESRVGNYPHEMSGGMKQRVVGAIAVSCRPRLLIADEPTTSLDVTIQAQYLKLLKDLQREFGMAMMFITHDFGVVARMCDRVCVLYAGQIVETASVRDIFRAPAHWYTAALIGGVPKLGRKIDRLISVPGAPPRLETMPVGCRFAPRCPNAQDKCRQENPPTTEIEPGHEIRCWYPRVEGRTAP
jgi:oligopeptide/dipeptide ABC transporter ATP-binding protein